MNCVACRSLFNEALHIPKLLVSCGHSICSSCSEAVSSSYKCPCCGVLSSVNVFPTNHALLALVTKSNNNNTTFNTTKQTSNNTNSNLSEINIATTVATDDQSSSSIPVPVNQSLEHQIHPTQFQFNTHTFNNESSNNNNGAQMNRVCKLHEGKRFDAFCVNTKHLLCIECVLSQDHHHHPSPQVNKKSIVTIERALIVETQDLQQYIEELLSKKQSIEAMIQANQASERAYKQEAQKSIEEVSTFYRSISAFVERRLKELRHFYVSDTATKEAQQSKACEQLVQCLHQIELNSDQTSKLLQNRSYSSSPPEAFLAQLLPFEAVKSTLTQLMGEIEKSPIVASSQIVTHPVQFNQNSEIHLLISELGCSFTTTNSQSNQQSTAIVEMKLKLPEQQQPSKQLQQQPLTSPLSRSAVNMMHKVIIPNNSLMTQSRPPPATPSTATTATQVGISTVIPAANLRKHSKSLQFSALQQLINPTKEPLILEPISKTMYQAGGIPHTLPTNHNTQKLSPTGVLLRGGIGKPTTPGGTQNTTKSSTFSKWTRSNSNSSTSSTSATSTIAHSQNERLMTGPSVSSKQGTLIESAQGTPNAFHLTLPSKLFIMPATQSQIPQPVSNNNQAMTIIREANIGHESMQESERAIDFSCLVKQQKCILVCIGGKTSITSTPGSHSQQQSTSLSNQLPPTNDSNGLLIEKCDLSTGLWQRSALSSSRNRIQFGVAMFKRTRVIIFGGKDDKNNTKLSSFEEIDTTNNSSTIFTGLTLSKPKSAFGFCQLSDDEVMIAGGSDASGQPLNEVEIYNLQTLTVRRVGNLSSPREELCLCLSTDAQYVYSFGGHNPNEKKCYNTVDKYSISKDKWVAVPPMKYARRAAQVVSLPDGFYVMGGFDGSKCLSSVEKFDDSTNSWVNIQRMTRPRAAFAAVPTADNFGILAISGIDAQPLRHAEQFSIFKGIWEVSQPLQQQSQQQLLPQTPPVAKYMHCAVLLLLKDNHSNGNDNNINRTQSQNIL